MVDREPGTPPAGFGQACSSVARAIADSLSLEDVLARIAAAARMRVPFDTMGIWHSRTPDDPVNLIRGPGAPEPRRPTDRPLRRADHSPKFWPVDGAPVCVGDAAREIDPAYPGDRLLVELGFR